MTQLPASIERAHPGRPSSPDPETRYRRRVGLGTAARELWQSRELVRSLAERDIRARYKQALLGFAWAVLTPLILMVVFTVVFTRVAHVNTQGVPYPLFAYIGLIPWTFFSSALSTGGMSLVNNNTLLNKVYCPREVFPLSGVIESAFDSVLSLSVLALLFVIYRFLPTATVAWVPVLLAVQVTFTLGWCLIVSSVLIYLRDLRQALPILLQLGLFVTPVAYSLAVIPPSYRVLYSMLNPLAPVIDGYRRVVLWDQAPDWHLLGPASLVSIATLALGYLLFKRLETGFADVA